MRKLVPIRIKVNRGLTNKGMKIALYPRFNDLKPEVRESMDWCHYIDFRGIGMHYDRVNSIGRGNDFEYAYTCVPREFAEAAAKAFQGDVTIITEQEFKEFYDRAHINDDIEIIDTEVVQGILARIQLEKLNLNEMPNPSSEILAARSKCLDPNCQDKRGIRKNPRKTWELLKQHLQVEIG